MTNKNDVKNKLKKSAQEIPIFDFHNHLSAQEIFNNLKFENITELGLGKDHYKWRLMRMNGSDEKYITGSAPPFDKFKTFANSIELAYGNPLREGTNMELEYYFNIKDELISNNSTQIYNKCNSLLNNIGPKELIESSNVHTLITTDDPSDTLEFHKKLLLENNSFKVLPGFRIGALTNPTTKEFRDYIKKINVNSYKELKEGLFKRIEYFSKNGCLSSDISLEKYTFCEKSEQVETIFKKSMLNETITHTQRNIFLTQLIIDLGIQYYKKDGVMQLHVGAFRNVVTRIKNISGVDSGGDISEDSNESTQSLSYLLDRLDRENKLPKTILFTLNDNLSRQFALIATSFNDGTIPGKIQLGAAWWHNDYREGILQQLNAYASTGVISTFVGMLTDSRSYTSFIRHIYFREILAEFLADIFVRGDQENFNLLEKTYKNICFKNSYNFFQRRKNENNI